MKKKKQILSLLLAGMMALSVVSAPTSAFADDITPTATSTDAIIEDDTTEDVTTDITTEEVTTETPTENDTRKTIPEVTTEDVTEEDTTEELKEEDVEELEEETPEFIEFDHNFSGIDVSCISTRELFVQTSDSSVFTKNTNVVSNYDDVYILEFDSVEQAQFAYSYYFDKVTHITDLSNTIGLSDEEVNTEDIADMSNLNNGNDAISNLNDISTGNYSGYIALIDSGAPGDVCLDVTGTGTGDSTGHGSRMYSYIKEENPGAKVLSIKAFSGGSTDAASVYAAIQVAINSHVSVINMSFISSYTSKNAIVVDAINEALANGITVIGAAGNYSTSATAFIPGGIGGVITVGAANDDGTLYEKSNYDADVYVVAESTSEATARYSGIYISRKDSNKVFTTLKSKEDVEETEDIDYSDDEYVKKNDVVNYNFDDARFYPQDITWGDNGTYEWSSYQNFASQYTSGQTYTGTASHAQGDAGYGVTTFGTDSPIYKTTSWQNINSECEGHGSNSTGSSGARTMPGGTVNYWATCSISSDDEWEYITWTILYSSTNGTGVSWSSGGATSRWFAASQVGTVEWVSIKDTWIAEHPVAAYSGYRNRSITTQYNDDHNQARLVLYYEAASKPQTFYSIVRAKAPLKKQVKVNKTINSTLRSYIDFPNNPNYSLDGTQITIYNNANDSALGTITVKQSGSTISYEPDHIDVTPGTVVYAKETKASKGYVLNTARYPTSGGVTINDDYTFNISNNPILDLPSTAIEKHLVYNSGEFNTNHADIIVNGAEYTLTQYYTRADALAGTNPQRSAKYIVNNNKMILSDLSYISGTNPWRTIGTNVDAPLGVYVLKETSIGSAVGVKLNTTDKILLEITQTSAGSNTTKCTWYLNNFNNPLTAEALNVDETPETGRITVHKVNAETGNTTNDGINSLEGIKFAVVNRSANKLHYGGVDYEPGRVIALLTTDANGFSTTYKGSTTALPYGTYQIYELRQDATITLNDVYDGSTKLGSSNQSNMYYLWSDTITTAKLCRETPVYDVAVHTERIRADGAVEDDTYPDAPIRGDANWIKSDIDGYSIPYIPYLVSFVSNGNVIEKHVILADANGNINTFERGNKSATTVNTLDQYYDGNGNYTGPLNDTAASVNIWFGNINNYPNKSVVNDYRGSFLVGQYKIEELHCANNEGQEMQEADLTVTKDRSKVDPGKIIIDLDIIPKSEALDVTSDSTSLTIGNEVSVNDHVELTHVKAGHKYRLVTRAINVKKDGTTEVLGESDPYDFVAEQTASTQTTYIEFDNTFNINSLNAEPGSYVALVDYLYQWIETENKYSTTPIMTHNEEMNVESQKLLVPEVTSKVTNTITKSRIGSLDPKSNIVDEITYKNLGNKSFYTFNIWLVDDDNTIVKDVNGNECKYSKEFYIDNRNDAVKLVNGNALTGPVNGTFTFETAGWDPWVIDKDSGSVHVVANFVDTFYNTVTVEHNTDLKDEDETVRYLEIGTTASSSSGKRGIIPNNVEAELVDIITYTNLAEDVHVEVEGTIVEKESKKVVTTKTEEYDLEKTYGADEPKQITMNFKFDSTPYAEKKLVVFEKVYLIVDGERVLISDHSDINDDKQTVRVPNIHTTLNSVVKHSNYKVTKNYGEISLIDYVTYKNVKPDEEYTMTCVLKDKVTGEDVYDIEGNLVTETITFTPEEENGVVEVPMTFKCVPKDIKWETDDGYVAFEELKGDDDISYVIHNDINDKGQTVYNPKFRTRAINLKESKYMIAAPNQKVIDMVTLRNFDKAQENGDKFTLKITAVDAKTGNVLKDASGNPYTNTKVFVWNGQKEEPIDITIDATNLEGKTVVFFENLYYGESTDGEDELLREEDADSFEQSLFVPWIRTTATDTNTNSKILSTEKKFVDTIMLKNIIPDQDYVIVTKLWDKDNNRFVQNTSGTDLVFQTNYHSPKNGVSIDEYTNSNYPIAETSVSIAIDVSGAEDISGKDIVVFEYMYYGKTTDEFYAEHTDKNDTDQTVKVVKVGTQAKDEADNDNVIDGTKTKQTIIDTVKYENLIVGETYTVTGKLVIKPTEEELKKADYKEQYVTDENGDVVTASVTFVAEKENGEIEVPFTFDASKYAGKKIVVFEDVLYKDITIGTHADINDKEQTIVITLQLHVKIAKADKDDIKYFLKGAEITIFDKDDKIVKDIDGNDCVGVTDENGEVNFTILYDEDNSYYAKETKAPNGYHINEDKFEIKPTGDRESLGTDLIKITILDSIIVIPPVPKTFDVILIVTSIMAVIGVCGIVISRKRKREV